MKKNVGGADKTVRIVLGIVLVVAGLFAPVSTGIRAGMFVVAVIALGTAFSGL